MRVCLIAPAGIETSAGGSPRLLAALLSQRHEVVLVRSGHPDGEVAAAEDALFQEVYAPPTGELLELKFSCEDHLHSAAAMAAIRRLYGDRGPDYLEVCAFGAHGLVPLQARRAGDPLLAETLIAVRASLTSELRNLHDGRLLQPGNKRLAELEREQLRLADRLIWPGGDCLGLYRRYYRDLELPRVARIRAPFEPPSLLAEGERREGPLRLLFSGDLRRSAGAMDLVEACRALPPESWSLTLTGRDTATAPMGQSMRAALEVMSGDDPRLRFEEGLGGRERAERLAAVDLLVVPARLAVSAETALTAMAAGVPVLATPVGDLTEAVEEGVGGWQAEDVGATALGRALCRLEADRGELARLRGSEAMKRRARELTDPERILDAYDDLLTSREPAPSRPSPEQPLVTVITPYYRASDYVAEAVASALAQTYPRVEVLIVNDGSFEPADAILDELGGEPRVRVVTQANAGEGPARTLGARLAAGEYVVMLDADNLLEPEFVERTLEVMRRNPDLFYVTCWLRMIGPDGRDTSVHPGYAPLGNSVLSEDMENWDGDTLALLRRSAFTESGFEYHPEGSMHSDWQLYRWMRKRGAYGAVIPERLARYRVLGTSLMRSYSQEIQDRSWGESREQLLLEGTRWVGDGVAR